MPELADIGQAIANTPLDIDELAEVAYVETARFLETDFFQLGLFEDDRYQTIICVREGKRIENREFLLSNNEEGIYSWIHQTGQSLLVSDFVAEAGTLPVKPSFDDPDPPTSGIFIPLLVGEAVIGILSVQSHQQAYFNQEHLHILTFIANILSAPLALTLLNDEIEYRKQQFDLMENISFRLISPESIDTRLSEVTILMSEALDTYAVAIYEYREDNFYLITSSIDDLLIPPLNEDLSRETIRSGISQVRHELPLIKQESDELDEPSFLNEFCIPLLAEKQILGLLQLVQRDSSFSTEQRAQTEMIAANIALAMLENRNYTQQQEENWTTTVLLEVARHAAQPGDLDQALQAVLQLTTLLTDTSWALLFIPEGKSHTFRLGSSSGLKRQTQFNLSDLPFQIESFGIATSGNFRTPLTIQLPKEMVSLLEAETAIAVPVISEKSLLSIFLLEGNKLPERQMALIEGIAYQISLRLENYRLIEEVAQRRSFEHELETARSIQESFLPRSIPKFPGWEIGVNWQVARHVGGDFYDFIPLDLDADNPCWGIVIADVTDKGIPASLFMALSRTLLRSVAISHIDPGKTLSRLNDLIFSDTQADLLISVFYAVWEPKLGRFSYANAGHNPPLLFYPQQSAKLLIDHDIIINATINVRYTTTTIEINPGELIVLYTDGVTEATDIEGDMFGLHRLENLVLGISNWNAQDIADRIGNRVADFCGTPDISDDLTIVVLYRPD